MYIAKIQQYNHLITARSKEVMVLKSFISQLHGSSWNKTWLS